LTELNLHVYRLSTIEAARSILKKVNKRQDTGQQANRFTIMRFKVTRKIKIRALCKTLQLDGLGYISYQT
jgi:hypothetical protein